MKKIFNISAILMACAMVLGISSCARETLSTDQFSATEVVLSSFGPNPVARGGTLRFIGSNLENVVCVSMPELEITDIEVVKAGDHGEIRVQLPKDGAEPGYVTLITKDNKTIKSKTELTFSEPIIFTAFITPTEKVLPGDMITVTGDYMNLIREVIFSNNVIVGNKDISHVSRYELKVQVPSEAVDGKIILGDVDETVSDELGNLYYSTEDLKVDDPTVTKAAKATYKAGDKITVKGDYLDMIKSIVIGTVEAEVASLADDHKSLTFELPAEAEDGTIYAVSYAGKKFAAGDIETVIPTSVKADPAPVKAGATLTITGNDLDLVTGLDFPSAKGAEFKYADGKITAEVPAQATEGDVTLNLANGKAVTTAITLVKPVITDLSTEEIVAGKDFKINGTDLDLATKVTLGGKEETFAASQDGKSIVVTTAATSVAGDVVITTANGTEVKAAQTMKVTYDSFIVVNSMPNSAHIGATVTLKGENFMMIDRIYIGDAKVTAYITRTDNEIAFVMPYNKIGTYPIKFELLTGESETCPTPIEVLLEQQIVEAWTGNVNLTWDDSGRFGVPYSAFSGVKAGATMRLYYTQKDQTWGQAQINNGAWTPIIFDGTKGTQVLTNSLVPTDVYGWTFDSRITELELTQTILDNINANHGDYAGTDAAIIIQGSDLIFTKVEIVQEISQETILWEGEAIATGWANQPYLLSDAGTELSAAGATVGQEVRFYITPLDDGVWKCQIVEGHWGPTYASFCAVGADTESGKFTEWDLAAHGGYVSITLTEDILKAALTQGWWGGTFLANGDKTKITKITLF